MKIHHRGQTATIYQKSTRDGTYRTSWYADGKRIQRNFKRLDEAKAAVMVALKNIVRGETTLASLTPPQLRDAKLAENALSELGISLLDAIMEYVAAKKLIPHNSLEIAAKSWVENKVQIQPIPLQTAVKEYLNYKKRRIAPRTYREEELRLERICQSIQKNVKDLTKSDLEHFFGKELHHLKGKSRNHYRQTFRQLFNYAVRRDYLSEKHRLFQVLVNQPTNESAPEILTPAEYKDLLSKSSPKMLPVIAIAGMTGARRSELMRLTWQDVWSVENYIELDAKKTKTKQRRLVPIQPSLALWLAPYKDYNGSLWPGSEGSFHSQLQILMRKCGISGQNLLRHSYASYRLAQIKDSSQVAMEMGNSPEKLFRNYNQLRTPKQSEEWFSITPSSLKSCNKH